MRVTKQITFESKDDAESIRIASERLGRDAVILSSRQVQKGGFLGLFSKTVNVVTAGILEEDQPEDLRVEETRERMMAFKNLLEVKKKEKPVVSVEKEDSFEFSKSAQQSSSQKILARSAINAYGDSTKKEDNEKTRDLTQDVDKIQETLSLVLKKLDEGYKNTAVLVENSHNQHIEKDEDHSSVDFRKDVRARLIKSEMTPAFVDDLLSRYRGNENLSSFKKYLAGMVKTPYTDNKSALGGKRVMFVGPTGVGKTTTIAKLSAVTSLWEDRKIVMATADTYRIAAVEQLRTYAKILGVPIEVIFDAEDLTEVRSRYNKGLILLDTAGRSQRDIRRLEEIKELYRVFEPDCVHLVISAMSKYTDMLDVIDRMGIVPITNILFTKIDETTTLGPVLEISINFALPISFFTTGQNVPNDIEIASADILLELVLGEDNQDV